MKKLVLALAVIASVSMISCTNNAEQATETEATEDTTMVVEEAPVDTTVVATDSTAAAPAEEAAPAAEEAPAEEPAK